MLTPVAAKMFTQAVVEQSSSVEAAGDAVRPRPAALFRVTRAGSVCAPASARRGGSSAARATADPGRAVASVASMTKQQERQESIDQKAILPTEATASPLA
eukprot:6193705-Pleurochrysis_carterae.AAC.3